MTNPVSTRATAAVRTLAPYQPGKPVSELERELGLTDIIKLASNENPLGPCASAVAAIKAAAADSWIYPDGSGLELKTLLAGSLGVEVAQLTLGNGSNDLLVMLAEAFIEAGASAVVSQYAFAVYPAAVVATGAQLRTAPALPRAHATMPLGHDLAAMAQLVDATTRLVFIANPNNPTGTLLPRDELRRFLAGLPADCGVVLDEAYFEYARHSGGSDGVAWLKEFPNLVVVRTFSKAFGLAGLRIGYAISDPAIAGMLNRVRQAFNVSHLGQAAAAAAWQDRVHLERSLAAVTAGAAQLQRGFAQLGLAVIPSSGNFFLVEFGPAALAVYDGLLRAGVIVRPVGNYGLPEFLRITIGTEAQNARLLAGLATVLASLRR